MQRAKQFLLMFMGATCISVLGAAGVAFADFGVEAQGQSYVNNTGQTAYDWSSQWTVPNTDKCKGTTILPGDGYTVSPDGKTLTVSTTIPGGVAPGDTYTTPTWVVNMADPTVCPNQLVPVPGTAFFSGPDGSNIGPAQPGVGYVQNSDGTGGVTISLVNSNGASEWLKNVNILIGYPWDPSDIVPDWTPPAPYSFTLLTASTDLAAGTDITWDFPNDPPGTSFVMEYDCGWVNDDPSFVSTTCGCPEPTACGLLGIGAVGLLGSGRRRRNTKA